MEIETTYSIPSFDDSLTVSSITTPTGQLSNKFYQLYNAASIDNKEEIIYLIFENLYESRGGEYMKRIVNDIKHGNNNKMVMTLCEIAEGEKLDMTENIMFRFCENGSAKIIEFLMKYDLIDCTKTDNKGQNYMHVLVKNQYANIDLTSKFLDYACKESTGFNPYQQDDKGNTPFHSSTMYPYSKKLYNFQMNYLRRYPDIVNRINKKNETPLMFIVSKENWKLFNYLIDRDDSSELFSLNVSQINSQGSTLLKLLILSTKEDLVLKVIKKYGKRLCLGKSNFSGETAFMLSIRHRMTRVSDALIRFGFEELNLKAINSMNENALLMSIFYRQFDISHKIIDYTTEDIDIKTIHNISPLMLAVDNAQEDIALKIIERGGQKLDFNLVNDQGDSILVLASLTELEDVILKILEMNKGNPEFVVSDTKTTALYYAIENGLFKVIPLLFERTPFSVFYENELVWKKLYTNIKRDPYYAKKQCECECGKSSCLRDHIKNKSSKISKSSWCIVYEKLEEIITQINKQKKIDLEIENKRILEKNRRIIEEFEMKKKKKNELKKKKSEEEKAKREAQREAHIKANQLKAAKVEEEKAKQKEVERLRFEQKKEKKNIKDIKDIKDTCHPAIFLSVPEKCDIKDVEKPIVFESLIDSLIELKEEINVSQCLGSIEDEMNKIFNRKYEIENWYFSLSPL